MNLLICGIFLPWLLLLSALSRAGEIVICVAAPAQLVNAVNSFSNVNGDTLRINIVQGTYLVGNQLGGPHASLANSGGIRLLGGYASDCLTRTINPNNTILDGANQANSTFSLIASGAFPVEMDGLTFTNFRGREFSVTSRLLKPDAAESKVAVRHCSFRNNDVFTVLNVASALFHVSDNVLADNLLHQHLRRAHGFSTQRAASGRHQ
jgi:trimeric autotransporter adhesin